MLFLNHMFAFGAGVVGGANWSLWDGTLDGSFTQFISSGSGITNTSVKKLSADKLIITWRDSNGPEYKGVIATTSGTSVSFGTVKSLIGASGVSANSIDILDSGRVIFTYVQEGSGHVYSAVLSVSGTTITVGTSVLISASGTSICRVDVVDTDKCVYTYNGASGLAAIGTISGTTVNTPGAALSVDSSFGGVAATVLDSTHLLLTYRDGSTGTGKALIALIGASTLTTPTAEMEFETGSVSAVSVCSMSSTRAVATYIDDGNSGRLTSCILDVSGTTITAQTPVQMDATASSVLSAVGNGSCKLDANKFMITFGRDTSGIDTYGMVGTITGSVIAAGTAIALNTSTGSGNNSNALIDANRVLAVAAISGNSGQARVLKTT